MKAKHAFTTQLLRKIIESSGEGSGEGSWVLAASCYPGRFEPAASSQKPGQKPEAALATRLSQPTSHNPHLATIDTERGFVHAWH